MSYPIPNININRLNITGKIVRFTTNSTPGYPLKFVYISTLKQLYKVCIPINSVFIEIIPYLKKNIIQASILEVITKDKSRYSLININLNIKK